MAVGALSLKDCTGCQQGFDALGLEQVGQPQQSYRIMWGPGCGRWRQEGVRIQTIVDHGTVALQPLDFGSQPFAQQDDSLIFENQLL